ncbi:MAG TPA: MFS transporter [Candidatus Binatia bacterium]
MDEPARGRESSWVRDFVLVAISRFGIFFSHRQTQPVFPVYLSSLGASGVLIGLIMSSFTVTATVVRPFVGLWIDRSGRKGFLLLGTALLAGAALGYAWAPSLALLVVFRMVQGLGWSAATTTVNTLAADIAPAERRGAMLAYAGLASNLGAALGPIAGFAAYERFGFHGMFLTVFGVIVMSLFFSLPLAEPQRPPAGEERSRSWLQLLFVRESFLPSIVMTFVAFGHAGVTTYIPLYVLEEKMGNPALYFAVEAVFVIVSRPIGGPLSDRFSRRTVILPGFALYLVGLVLIALAPSIWFLLAAAAFNGMGVGLVHAPLMALAIDRVPAGRRGLSMAQFQTFHELGNMCGTFTLGALLDLTARNFSRMFFVAAAVVASGFVLYIAAGKEPMRRRSQAG